MPWARWMQVVRVSTDLRALKRETLTGLASRLAGTQVHGVSPRTRRNPDALRMTWEFENGAHALVVVATVKQGLPAGRFALEPRLLMSGGPLADALGALSLPPSPAWDANHHLVNADCRTLGGPTGTFIVRPEDSTGVNRAEADIEAYLLPAIAAFSGDWSGALRIAMAHPAAVAFAGATAAILIGWTGRVDLVPELRAAAVSDPWVRQAMSQEEFAGLVDGYSNQVPETGH